MSSVDLARVGANLVKNALTAETVELKTLWQDHPIVLFFLRRFGCQVCRWTASEVSKLKESFDSHNVRLIGVGPEEVGLKEFLDGNYFKGDVYIDEKKQCYKDLGFKRYNALTLVPAALGKKVRQVVSKANADGIEGNFMGDLLQSGGMLIVSKDIFTMAIVDANCVSGGEKVLLHFIQDSPGDHVPLETIIQMLGITATDVKGGQKPQCNDDVCAR